MDSEWFGSGRIPFSWKYVFYFTLKFISIFIYFKKPQVVKVVYWEMTFFRIWSSLFLRGKVFQYNSFRIYFWSTNLTLHFFLRDSLSIFVWYSKYLFGLFRLSQCSLSCFIFIFFWRMGHYILLLYSFVLTFFRPFSHLSPNIYFLEIYNRINYKCRAWTFVDTYYLLPDA